MIEILRKIPDFSIDLKLNFDSNIFHIFTQYAPCDYYKISKTGGNLRVDLNISSLNTSFKTIRGKCTIIIQDKQHENKINILKIDNEKKTVHFN